MQIVVRQVSGLGNQLFQYTAGRYFANRYGAQMSIVVDPSRNAVSHGYPRPFLLSHFSITAPFHELTVYDRLILTWRGRMKPAGTVLRSMLGTQAFTQEFTRRYTFLQDIPIQNGIRTVYLIGYWQAYRFADEIADELRTELRFREPARDKNLEVLQRIQQSTNPVSLHIRRGDYTLAAEGNIALPIDYYNQGIRFFRDRLVDPTFFVFSDDINFAKANLPRDIRTVFIDHNASSSAHEDLRLMSNCRDHIVANSTFSWWGAWLNPRADKTVFAPRYWHLNSDSYYPDLLPPSWTLADHRDK
jgi:hypothetical protein